LKLIRNAGREAEEVTCLKEQDAFSSANYLRFKTGINSCSIKLKLSLGELEFDVQNISAKINEQIKERDFNKMEAVWSLPKIEVPTFSGDAKD